MKPLCRTLLAAALALGATPALAQEAAPYSQTIFFGDSLTESGFYQPFLVEQVGPNGLIVGKWTTNPSLVWAEYLADFYGTDGTPAWGLTSGGIVGDSGGNYAAGGARITQPLGFPPVLPTQGAPSLSMQVDAYLAANAGRADPDALFTVWGGANDLFFHLNGAITQAQFFATAGEQAALVSTLQAAGARYVMVATIPDVGVSPFGLSLGPAGSAGLTALVGGYNQVLFQTLAQSNLQVIPLDTFNLVREIAANASQFGFANVTTPACGAVMSLLCSPLDYVSPDAATSFAFADGVHPTSGAHRIIADYAVSILEGPRQIAVLPHSAAMTGRARAERVAMHLDGKPAGDGTRWWGDVRGDHQRYAHGDAYDGPIAAVTVGVDWSRGNLVYGAFGGFGHGRIDYSRRRGDFDQDDATIGGFVGWYGDSGAWVNGQASYTNLSYDIDREVYLGPAKRSHTGSTDGDNITVAVQAGWTFGDGALRHGPVLGLVSQRIDVDGYAESEPNLSTSLAYPDQDFDSLIGSAGWQASYAINDHLRPYARLTWDREFEESDAQAFARSQSIAGSLPYAVPGVDYDRDYGTLTIGARSKVFGFDANLGTSLTVGQKGGSHATVFATFGGGF